MSRIHFFFFLQTEDEKFHVNVCNRWTDIYVRMHDSQIKYLPWKMILSLLNEPIWIRRDNITPEIQINCLIVHF